MKKLSLLILLLAVAISSILCLSACNGEQGPKGDQGEKGEQGIPGAEPTIEISEDGYWVINGEKTNVKATPEGGAATDTNPQGLAFYPKDDGTYVVEIGMAKYLSKIEIPSSYNGMAVTEVGRFSNDGNAYLKEIIIPDSVIKINEKAFYYCTSLTSVVIPNSVTSIGDMAFSECPIETATLPTNAISHISKINLKTVIINGGESIEFAAFRNCSELINVTIGDSVTSIGEGAFFECTGLVSAKIGSGVTSIGRASFSFCLELTNITVDDGNPAYKSIDGNLYSKDGKTLIQYTAGKEETIFTIPDGVMNIGTFAISYCDNLTSIVIPASVTDIDTGAFYSCKNLLSVEIPNSVTRIGNSAFEYCTSLRSVEIPNSVTSIEDCLFLLCSSLTTVVIPDSVTSIGKMAFDYCPSLTSITFSSTEGWWVSASETATEGTTISSADLTDSSTAAEYLANEYKNYYWHKN